MIGGGNLILAELGLLVLVSVIARFEIALLLIVRLVEVELANFFGVEQFQVYLWWIATMIFFDVSLHGSIDLTMHVLVYALQLLIQLLDDQLASFLYSVGNLPIAFVFKCLEMVLQRDLQTGLGVGSLLVQVGPIRLPSTTLSHCFNVCLNL